MVIWSYDLGRFGVDLESIWGCYKIGGRPRDAHGCLRDPPGHSRDVTGELKNVSGLPWDAQDVQSGDTISHTESKDDSRVPEGDKIACGDKNEDPRVGAVASGGVKGEPSRDQGGVVEDYSIQIFKGNIRRYAHSAQRGWDSSRVWVMYLSSLCYLMYPVLIDWCAM